MSGALVMLAPLLPLTLAFACLHRSTRLWAQRGTPWAVLPAFLVLLLPDSDMSIPGLLLDARMRVDDTGRAFLGLSAALWCAAAVYARATLAGDPSRPRFHAFFLGAMAGNFGLIVAGDALGFYLWFTVMSLSAYGLIIHDGSAAARRAGFAYMALVVASELLLFAGLVLHASKVGSVAFADMAEQPVAVLPALLMLTAFAVKIGAMPVHVWLPLAHPAAPVPASAVLSGAMIKAGLLGLMRFLPPEQGLPPWLASSVMTVAAVTMLLAVLLGVGQTRAKTVLAYSSVSQMGFMLLGLGIAWREPEWAAFMATAVTLYAVHHGLAKAALFLGVGVIGSRTQPNRLLWLGLALPGLALAGLPLSSGAAAKTALKVPLASLNDGPWLTLLLAVAALGTSLLMTRYLWLLYRSPAKGEAHPAAMCAWGALVLTGVSVSAIWPAAREMILASFTTKALLWAVVPIMVGCAMSACFIHRPLRNAPKVPEGDLWCLIERGASRVGRIHLRVQRMPSWQWAGRWTRLALQRIAQQEVYLTREPVPGAVLLLVMVTVFLLLRA